MKYVGIDLHKKNIVVCVVDKERKILQRKKRSGGGRAATRDFAVGAWRGGSGE